MYFTELSRAYRAVAVVIDDTSGLAPMTMVEHAKELDRLSRRAKARTGVADHDEIWCVFDIDEHPNVARAVNVAREAGIHVAVSNPCFEVWLLLHAVAQTAHVERKDAARRCIEAGLLDGKRVLPTTIKSVQVAVARAVDLDRKHELDGSPPGSNPSSGVHRLATRIVGES